MRQLIIAFSLTGSFALFALVTNLFDTAVMFLLFGILPGQTEPLSANQMLAIYATASVFVSLYALRPGIVTISNLLSPQSDRSNA